MQISAWPVHNNLSTNNALSLDNSIQESVTIEVIVNEWSHHIQLGLKKTRQSCSNDSTQFEWSQID